MNAWRLPWLLAGVLAGAALQLVQPQLWPGSAYAAGMAAAVLLAMLPWCRQRAGVMACAALAMFALCGLRALAFQAQALDPRLEGRDLRVQGMVAAMPQRGEAGLRFRFAVESAWLDGQAVRLPPMVELGWYASGWQGADAPDEHQRPLPALRAGQRWEATVRLKVPHGARNPHGFDYELWLWEQGVQAMGYVRAGRRDAAPRLLSEGWHHPVEQWRQQVRDAIVLRLAQPQAEAAQRERAARAAGVVAALVTGDQRAIDLEADIKVENWASL